MLAGEIINLQPVLTSKSQGKNSMQNMQGQIFFHLRDKNSRKDISLHDQNERISAPVRGRYSFIYQSMDLLKDYSLEM